MGEGEVSEDDYEEDAEYGSGDNSGESAELTAQEAADSKTGKKEPDGQKKEGEYEDVCFICRRPESKTGKMFKLPNNITVCNDCMHKTMDTVSQFDYQGMLNNPAFMNDLNKSIVKRDIPISGS